MSKCTHACMRVHACECMCTHVCIMCVCVCVWKKERGRLRGRQKNLGIETDRQNEWDRQNVKWARLKTDKMSETDRETVPVLQGIFLPESQCRLSQSDTTAPICNSIAISMHPLFQHLHAHLTLKIPNTGIYTIVRAHKIQHILILL